MTKRLKRFLVEFPDDTTELIIAHPGGHIDVIEVDHGDEAVDDAQVDADETVSAEWEDGNHRRPRRKR